MNPLGFNPKITPTPVSRTPQRAETVKSDQIEQQKDLVQLTGGTVGRSLVPTLGTVAKTALMTGLPLAGALLAGPAGAAVAVLATGAIAYAEQTGGSKGQRLKKAAGKALVGAAVGLLPAGLGAAASAALGTSLKLGATLLGAAGAGLVSGLAGQASFKIARSNGKASFRPTAFSKAYLGAVQKELSEKGVDWKPKQLGLLGRLSPKARKEHADKLLVATAVMATRHLGPAAALAIANQLGKDGLPEDKRLAADKVLLKRKLEPVSTEVVDGIPVYRVEGLTQAESSPAVAQLGSVYLDSKHDPAKGEVLADFVLGHEFSHVKHQDVVGSLAEGKIVNTVQELQEKSSDSREKAMLAEVGDQLEQTYYKNSRETEFRCDAEGFDYARSRGHSAEEIVSAATEFFGTKDRNDSGFVHPSGKKRVDALEQQAQGNSE